MTTTRRWVKAEGSQGYWSIAAAIEAQVRAVEATMAGMGTTPISRDYAIPANRQRNESLAASAILLTKLGSALAQIDALVHTFASTWWHPCAAVEYR
ncbi:hypothetical protein AB0M83_09440 [Amycolatopsis sp. NPDC051106]|uniref:hypothetical protein n=1 Tax=unclassified Amycolatopsis TaxID=2618356 RepID=UPI00342D2C4D